MDSMAFLQQAIAFILCTLFIYDPIDACTCQPAHPQTHFCKADFVVKATVKDSVVVYSKTKLESGRTRRDPFERKFRITINKVLKESDGFQNVSHRFIHTPYHDSVCGIHLESSTKYLLTGRIVNDRLYMTICNFYRVWSKLPVRMRKGFNFQYEKNCGCGVTIDFRSSNNKHINFDDHCQLNVRDDPANCYSEHAMCKKIANGKCHWTRPELWRTCMKKAEEDAMKEP